ncbi:MAG: hypothetical protein ACFCU3_07520 [Verrucomicrobiales bacterium]
MLLPRLRDPLFTRLVLVTLPEATPVHEAIAVQEDLARAGMKPHTWVLNQSLSSVQPEGALLRERALAERSHLQEVLHQDA